MEEKSESISSVKKNNLETLLNMLPEFPISKIMDFLVGKDIMALSFVSKKLNLKTKVYRTTKFKEENLLDCMLAIWVFEQDVPSCGYFVENCVDYKTGGKFNVFDYEVRVRTLRDFAEYFVEPKNNNEYDHLIERLSDNYKSYNRYDTVTAVIVEANIAYVKNLILIGCNKSYSDLWKEHVTDTKKYKKHKYEKQIKNYENVTGNSYKRIYDSINKPENRIPQVKTHHYINAYEK